MGESDALRTYIRNLNYAIATTACSNTVHMLRQMLKEAAAKLSEMEEGRSAGDMTASAAS